MAGEGVREINVSEGDNTPPPVVDDAARPAVGLPLADRPSEDQPESDEPSVSELQHRESPFDAMRNSIGESYAQRRAAALGLDKDTQSDEPGAEGAAKNGAPSAAALTGKVPIKVHGVEIQMDLADAVRIAQESLAAGQTLDTAKARADEMLREAAVNRGDAPGAQQPEQKPTDPNDPAPSKTKMDPARLISAVEQVQVGTTEEGAQLLASAIDEELDRRLAGITPKPIDDESVEQALVRREAKKQAETALQDFSERYVGIAQNEDTIDLVMKQLNREMLKDFERIGMSPENLARAKADPALLVEGFVELSHKPNPKTGKPWGLRSYAELLDAAGDEVSQRFNLEVRAKPGAEPGHLTVDLANRRAAKNALPQQPRSAGLRADGRLNGSAQQQPARMSGSQIVAEELRARGFNR